MEISSLELIILITFIIIVWPIVKIITGFLWGLTKIGSK